jgi:hypothetical protein
MKDKNIKVLLILYLIFLMFGVAESAIDPLAPVIVDL